MNLPKAVEILDEKKMVIDQPVSAAQTSTNMLDVEYDENHNDDDNEVLFNGIMSMAQQHLPRGENRTIEVRDYSIDTWNGSPGLKAWGYDARYPNG